MCENPVGYLGLLGVFGFKWVCLGFSFSILAFLCVCAYGYEGRKCEIPLICPFLGSYLSFRL